MTHPPPPQSPLREEKWPDRLYGGGSPDMKLVDGIVVPGFWAATSSKPPPSGPYDMKPLIWISEAEHTFELSRLQKKIEIYETALEHPDIEDVLHCECGYFENDGEGVHHKCLQCTLKQALAEGRK